MARANVGTIFDKFQTRNPKLRLDYWSFRARGRTGDARDKNSSTGRCWSAGQPSGPYRFNFSVWFAGVIKYHFFLFNKSFGEIDLNVYNFAFLTRSTTM